jgi:hypothetical protein
MSRPINLRRIIRDAISTVRGARHSTYYAGHYSGGDPGGKLEDCAIELERALEVLVSADGPCDGVIYRLTKPQLLSIVKEVAECAELTPLATLEIYATEEAQRISCENSSNEAAGWISVEDELPKAAKGSVTSQQSREVAVLDSDGYRTLASYHHKHGWWDSHCSIGIVTHWCDLPGSQRVKK